MYNEPLLFFGTGVSAAKDYDGLLSVCSVAIENGILAFDTAPSYKTEKILGEVFSSICSKQGLKRSDLFLQTKIDPLQMITGEEGIKSHIYNILDDLHTDYLDGLLVHWPLPEYIEETWKTMLKLKKEGIVKKVGICNIRKRQLIKITESEKPDMIQIERNPLRTCSDEIDFCHSEGIVVQAYSPLCKMHSDLKYSKLLANLSDKYERDIGEIVLRWHLDTGVIPIFTSKNTSRIEQYSAIFDFKLEKDDIEQITAMNKNFKMYLESWLCPGF